MMFAARTGDIETTKVLLEAGADLTDTAASGVNALTQAARQAKSWPSIYWSRGLTPALERVTPLHAAVLRGEVTLVRELSTMALLLILRGYGTPGRRFSADYSIRSQLIDRDAFYRWPLNMMQLKYFRFF